MRVVIRGVLAWIIGAAVAVGVGMLALSRIGYGFTMGAVQPLSSGPATVPAVVPSTPPPSAAVPPAPASEPAPSAPPTPGGRTRPRPRRSPASSPMSHERAFSSLGGSVIVRCSRDLAYLMSWSPEQGYQVDDVRRGPAPEVTVEFEDADEEVRLRVWCDDDIPEARIAFEHDKD